MAAILSCALVFSGCSKPAQSSDTGEFADAQALLVAAWEAQSEDEKPAIIGGVTGDVSDELPLALDLKEKETIESALNVPGELIEASSSGASMMNAMMANSFTVSAWQLKDASKAKEMAAKAGDQLSKTHWVCSTPDQYQIIQVSEFLVIVYGLDGQVDPFVSALKSVAPEMNVLEKGKVE